MPVDIGDPFFLAFLTAMQRHNVRYMLIGGLAVTFHGHVRNTLDMDIWLAPTNQNRDRFFEALLDLEYTDEELSFYKNEDFTTYFKCTIGEMPFTVDCLTIVHPNLNFDEAEKVMIKHDIGNGLLINVVDFDFLRRMKILTHREKDWQDVSELDKLRKR